MSFADVSRLQVKVTTTYIMTYKIFQHIAVTRGCYKPKRITINMGGILLTHLKLNLPRRLH